LGIGRIKQTTKDSRIMGVLKDAPVITQGKWIWVDDCAISYDILSTLADCMDEGNLDKLKHLLWGIVE